MTEVLHSIIGNSCKVTGVYIDDNGTFPLSMLNLHRENELSLKRKKVNYNINITVAGNTKTISINTNYNTSIYNIYMILGEILRFENLFEGCFFNITSFKLNEKEYLNTIDKYILSYFKSNKTYTRFNFSYSNNEYRRLYFKWKKLEKNLNIIHPVFLFSTFIKGMTADVNMAQLLQVFEPIAEKLHHEGKIVLTKQPFITFSEKCPSCGTLVSKSVPNKSLYFSDKLKPVMDRYGKDIFKGDSNKKIIEKAIGIRNKVDHVKATRKKVMSGGQCGFYIQKFSLLYRYIILLELELEETELNKKIVEWTKQYNNQFPNLRIKY